LGVSSGFKKMLTGNVLIDAVFLTEKGKKEQLIKTVKELQSQFPDLNFLMTGPWPPYSFVDITIK
jgi:hypothetical protein